MNQHGNYYMLPNFDVMSLQGFTSAEARIGLRATYGNVEAAEELITRKRKERELAREQNDIKQKLDRYLKLF